jgi:hypothetical protein
MVGIGVQTCLGVHGALSLPVGDLSVGRPNGSSCYPGRAAPYRLKMVSFESRVKFSGIACATSRDSVVFAMWVTVFIRTSLARIPR